MPRGGHELRVIEIQTARLNPGSTDANSDGPCYRDPREVQAELIGTAVILTDGKAGTVETVWLDELHGLRISIRGHDGKWPISTIKLAGR